MQKFYNKDNLVAPAGEMDDFKRPDHPDFMDSAELRKIGWSGYRMNALTTDAEIWLKGEVKASISPQDLALNPQAINEAMADIFALDEAMPDTPQARAYITERNSKADNLN